MDDILFLEATTTLSTTALRNKPRKFIYSNTDMGWRAFNNHEQTPLGNNGLKEFEDDDTCKDRYMFVTFTALEDQQSIDFKTSSKDFSRYPVLAEFMAGAMRSTFFAMGSLSLMAASIIY